MSTTASTSSPVEYKTDYLKIISIIAHNVKGPVKYMQYITDYTLEHWRDLKPEDLRDCALAINESSRRIGEQLIDIMNWARVQDGSFNPTMRDFSVNKSIKKEIKLLKPIIRLKKISLSKDFEKKLTIQSDENILLLAFHNIIANATKFTSRKGTIHLSTHRVQDLVIIVVQDSGVGMSEEELAFLHDDQAFSNPGTVEEHGTGFGLRIAKELIQLLHGSLTIESVKDEGTTVKMFLPA